METKVRVEHALARYTEPLSISPHRVEEPSTEHLATPDRLAYALGWIVADSIISLRFANSAIDALPIFHPDHGWDRFLLTRRVSSPSFAHESADRFGSLCLCGEDAPRLVARSGEVLETFRSILLSAPEALREHLDRLLPSPTLQGLDADWAWKRKRVFYPTLYSAITDLVVTYPGIVCSREIFVDSAAVGDEFHPLFLHSAGRATALQYDWFQIQYGDRLVFVRTHGEQAIFESMSGGWRTARGRLRNESAESLKRRILAWLRIEGDLDSEMY